MSDLTIEQRLAAAEADRDRLAREHEDCDAQRRSLVSQGLAAIRKAEAAEAYRDRLREALREIADAECIGCKPGTHYDECPAWVVNIQKRARAALAASEVKP